MANSTLPDTPPEEKNNPGQEEYQQLTRRFGNPNNKDNSPAGNPTDPRSNDVAAGDALVPGDTPSSDDLSTAEQNPDAGVPVHENRVGRGYRSTRSTSKKTGPFNWSGYSPRKKWMVGAGGGLLGGGIIALVIFLLSIFRLDGYLSGINQKVFAAANNAVSQRVDNLFERYMITKVISMQRCGNKITAECRNDYSKEGFAKDLFNSWQDARVENRLFEQYGLEVQSYKNSTDGKERFKIIDKTGRFGSPGDELTIKDGKLVLGKFEGGPRIFGKEWGKFIKNETRWDQVLQRRSVRKYLVRKHGAKFWCFFACQTKDSIDNAKLSAKTKLKYKLVERVIYPFSPKLGVIMDCLLTDPQGPNCKPDALRARGIDPSAMSDDELAKLTKSLADNPNQKLSQVLIQKILERIVEKETAQRSVSAIPIAGQIYFALSVIDMLNTADKCLDQNCLSKFAADLNSDQYLEYYTAMRSADDELKSGALSLEEAGALSSQFNDGDMPAEQSLVYQADNTTNRNTASIFSGSAFAASTAPDSSQKSKYQCADGKPIPAGQFVCNEKKVTRTYAIEDIRSNNVVAGLDGILNIYQACPTRVTIDGRCLGLRPVTVIHPLLKGVNQLSTYVLGPLVKGAVEGFKLVPGVNDVIGWLEGKFGDLLNAFLGKIFPLPVQPDSFGREKYDGLHAGGEVMASEFNKGGYTDDGQPYGLGGQLLTDKEQASASQVYLDQEDYDNNHGSIISRVASTNNPSSLLMRFAMAMPGSWSQFSDGLASLFTHPFRDFGAVWRPAYAASATNINAFGIPRFGYLANDSAFTADPAKYTPEYCQQQQQKWQASKTDDPVSGIDEYSTTNPCLLEQVAVEAASSVFTQDDSVGDGDNSSQTSISGALPTGSAQDLAKQILATSSISFTTSLAQQAVADTAAGRPAQIEARCNAGSSSPLSPTLLGVILKISENHKIGLGYITNGCHSANSAHYSGRAADINSVDGKTVTGGDADRSFMHELTGILPNGSGIGQESCSAIPIKPINRVILFEDSCDHIHIQVP